MVRSRPKAFNSCTSSKELDAQYVWPHQKPKRPHLQEKDMPVAFCRSCHVSPQRLKLQRKRSFWWFRPLSLWDIRNSGTFWKRCITVRPTVALYLNELLIQKCQLRQPFSHQSPTKGLPPLALWHLVGVTIGITLDKKGSLKRSVRNWVL